MPTCAVDYFLSQAVLLHLRNHISIGVHLSSVAIQACRISTEQFSSTWLLTKQVIWFSDVWCDLCKHNATSSSYHCVNPPIAKATCSAVHFLSQVWCLPVASQSRATFGVLQAVSNGWCCISCSGFTTNASSFKGVLTWIFDILVLLV